MRAVLEFRSTGKGVFALRKTLKVTGGIELELERDPDNLKGVSSSISIIICRQAPVINFMNGAILNCS